MPERIRHYLYVSRSTLAPGGLEGAIQDIVKTAEKLNAERAITGVLIMSRGYFCQLIEGPSASIEALVHELNRDPRHEDLRVLEDGYRDSRWIGGWAMAYAGAPVFLGSILERLHINGPDEAAVKRLVTLLLQFAQRQDTRGMGALLRRQA